MTPFVIGLAALAVWLWIKNARLSKALGKAIELVEPLENSRIRLRKMSEYYRAENERLNNRLQTQQKEIDIIMRTAKASRRQNRTRKPTLP
jgi:hypothetical protein